MVEQGLGLSRDTSGRSRATALTAKGRRLYDRVAQAALAREEQLLADFSPKQVENLIGLLTSLSKAVTGLTDAVPKGARRSNTAAGASE
jgi:hypothetical protein